MLKGYSVSHHFDNTWHVKHQGTIIANVEGIDKIKNGKQVTKGVFKKKPVSVYVVTNLPGASDEHFLTVHAAANHAASHHNAGGHLVHTHPISSVKQHIQNLEQAIWSAASDPRMDDHQEKLLQVSKAHAQMRNVFHQHFGNGSK